MFTKSTDVWHPHYHWQYAYKSHILESMPNKKQTFETSFSFLSWPNFFQGKGKGCEPSHIWLLTSSFVSGMPFPPTASVRPPFPPLLSPPFPFPVAPGRRKIPQRNNWIFRTPREVWSSSPSEPPLFHGSQWVCEMKMIFGSKDKAQY